MSEHMNKQIDLGPTKSIGVGLKKREIDEIDVLARELGFTRNAIMGWMIRHAMQKIRDGQFEIPIETQTQIKRYLADP